MNFKAFYNTVFRKLPPLEARPEMANWKVGDTIGFDNTIVDVLLPYTFEGFTTDGKMLLKMFDGSLCKRAIWRGFNRTIADEKYLFKEGMKAQELRNQLIVPEEIIPETPLSKWCNKP